MMKDTAFEKDMLQEIKKNLEQGEQLIKIIETFSLKNTPELLALTDRRIMYFDKKMFGRYEFYAIPYMKMSGAKARVGKIWGEFIIEGEDESIIRLEKVKKEGIVSAFEAMKEAINAIAIEPLSIIHKKGLMVEEWRLSKPPEMIIRQKIEDDPFNILKSRYAKGEITEDEYIAMKELLES